MGRTPHHDRPLDVRDRCSLIYGEAEREWRVHLLGGTRVLETLYVRAPTQDDAKAMALAFSNLGRIVIVDGPFGKSRSLESAITTEPEYGGRVLVEPIFRCAGAGCSNFIIAPDPRTARYPEDHPRAGQPFEDALGNSKPGTVYCTACYGSEITRREQQHDE